MMAQYRQPVGAQRNFIPLFDATPNFDNGRGRTHAKHHIFPKLKFAHRDPHKDPWPCGFNQRAHVHATQWQGRSLDFLERLLGCLRSGTV